MDIIAQIEKKIEENLEPSIVEFVDESAMHGNTTPSHLRVLIVSKVFEGMSSVERHQKVYQAIGMELLGQIHAFSQKTYTLKEWEEGEKALGSSPPCHKRKS